MKRFDLKAALAGEPVVTRDGRPVENIVWNERALNGYRIAGWVGGVMRAWWDHGGYRKYREIDHAFDLFMAAKKRVVWVNLYNREMGSGKVRAQWFEYEDDADAVNGCAVRIGGKAWPLEIEE